MTYIIKESKRDDLLLPYLEMVKANFPDLTLGKFKSMMLEKLAAQGGIHNLSLSSNYYLAGATKYYFNGDLTKDHKTHFGEQGDLWDTEICERLNAVILILRDAYIDSIGTAFEQPEDFGTLSLPKLLRKYGKKIDAILGVKREVKKKATPEIDMSPRVGNGYTFDILYNYEDATKYCSYTAPGSWCITYGDYHFNSYIKRLGIHYVIFLKDGYENVQRPEMPVNKRKPHDEYGNSMIAVLQSNSNYHPVYITSRWNHGYGESSGTEADHAYTEEEFMRITGVTPEDLKRIYKIWDMNRAKGSNADRSEANAAKKKFIHKLKYAQMRINGGEDPRNFFVFSRRLLGNPDANDLKKWVCSARPKREYFAEDTPDNVSLIIDRGNVVFDAISWGGNRHYASNDSFIDYFTDSAIAKTGMGNFILCTDRNGYSFYDARRKQVVSIDGVKKFKYIPDRWTLRTDDGDTPVFFQVKNTSTTAAFIDVRTGQPLKLPNGECWFNYFRAKGFNTRREDTRCYCIPNSASLIEIVYDASSNEKYFYSTKTRSWVQMPSSDDAIGIPGLKPLLMGGTGIDGLDWFTLKYTKGGEASYEYRPQAIFDGNLKQITMGGFKSFGSIEGKSIGDEKFIAFTPWDYESIDNRQKFDAGNGFNKQLIYRVKTNDVLKIQGKYLMTNGVLTYGATNYIAEEANVLPMNVVITETVSGPYEWNHGVDYTMFYDIRKNGILLNPVRYPSEFLFKTDDNSSGYSEEEYKSGSQDNGRRWTGKSIDEGFIAVYKKAYELSQWGESYFNSEEKKKVLAILNLHSLKSLPLDAPQQNQSQVGAPAIQIRESDIANLVKQTLNELYGKFTK